MSASLVYVCFAMGPISSNQSTFCKFTVLLTLVLSYFQIMIHAENLPVFWSMLIEACTFYGLGING